jgi:hypothetical protein
MFQLKVTVYVTVGGSIGPVFPIAPAIACLFQVFFSFIGLLLGYQSRLSLCVVLDSVPRATPFDFAQFPLLAWMSRICV